MSRCCVRVCVLFLSYLMMALAALSSSSIIFYLFLLHFDHCRFSFRAIQSALSTKSNAKRRSQWAYSGKRSAQKRRCRRKSKTEKIKSDVACCARLKACWMLACATCDFRSVLSLFIFRCVDTSLKFVFFLLISCWYRHE